MTIIHPHPIQDNHILGSPGLLEQELSTSFNTNSWSAESIKTEEPNPPDIKTWLSSTIDVEALKSTLSAVQIDTMLVSLSPTTISFLFLSLGFFLIRYLNSTDQPKIKGLPEIPGVPLFGNLLQLGQDHARVTARWAKKYGWPVFQTRLGNRRIIFANSFDSVKHFWITNQSSLISRPTLYTFHSVVSSSQGFTIGTSPWDESCKRRRKVAATALNKPAVQSYMPFIDLESCVAIKDMFKDSMGGSVDLDPRKYFHRFALNTSLTLNYGIRIDGGIDQELLREGQYLLAGGKN